jgi:hypothetical protein
MVLLPGLASYRQHDDGRAVPAELVAVHQRHLAVVFDAFDLASSSRRTGAPRR